MGDDVGNRIRQLRTARGMTMEELAHAAGVTLSTVSRIEKGRIARPAWHTMVAMAQALGVTPNDLGGEG